MSLFHDFLRRSLVGRRRKNRRSLPSLFRVIELLEERMVLSAVGIEPNLLFAPGTSHDYVDQFRREDENPTDIAQYRLNDRFNATATDGGTGPLGDPITVTWSIVRDGVYVPGYAGETGSGSNLVGTFRGIYGVVNNPDDTTYQGEPWFEAIESSFDRWNEVGGLTYVYEPNDDGASFAGSGGAVGVRGDVRIAGHTIDGPSGILAYNFYPDTADMVLDTADSFYATTSGNSLRLRNVVAHEAGHGLGLAHVESNNASFLMEPFINLNFDGPQLDDILGTQRGYGDGNETGAGNNTAGTATGLGAIGAGQSVTIGTDAPNTFVAAADTDFVSIDDNSDIDFFSFAVVAGSRLDVVLTPRGPTYNEGPQNGAQSPYNTSAFSNLTLEVIDTNGTAVLGFANSTGLGGTETLNNVPLTVAGTYFVRVTGANNAAQFYELDLSVTQSQANPGVTIAQSNNSTNVTEGGTSDTYTIVLNSQPAADVTISIGVDSQLATDSASVTFTPVNWNSPRLVTVTAVDDDAIEGTHSGTISHSASSVGDSNYHDISVASVAATITDNDIPGVVIVQSNGSTNVSEDGTTDTYSIVLTARPSENVVIAINPNSELLTDLALVTFTPMDWNSPQTVEVSAVDDNDIEGNHAGVVAHTASSDDSNYSEIAVPSVTANITDNDESDEQSTFYFALQNATTVGSISMQNEDIVAFDGSNYSLLFDGSDVGLSGLQIDAFDVLNDTDILLSFSKSSGNVDDSDVILFRATSLGENTAGGFYWYFDASDVGLTRGGEDVDAVTLLSDGSLLLSTVGSSRVSGLSFRDEDIVRFIPSSLGSNTSGSFEMFLDGSDSNIGLSQSRGEDIDGMAVLAGNLYLTTVGNFSVPGVSGRDEDVFVFNKSEELYDSQLFVDFNSNDVRGFDFPGVAGTDGLGLVGSFRSTVFDPLGIPQLISASEFTTAADANAFRFFSVVNAGSVDLPLSSSFDSDPFSPIDVQRQLIPGLNAGHSKLIVSSKDDEDWATDDEFEPEGNFVDLQLGEFSEISARDIIDQLFTLSDLLDVIRFRD